MSAGTSPETGVDPGIDCPARPGSEVDSAAPPASRHEPDPPDPGRRPRARSSWGRPRADGRPRPGGWAPGDGRPRGDEPPTTGSAAVDPEPDPESVARSVALRLLTGAPRSRAQLAEAMARRDVPDDVVDRVLDRFTEVGLIDDAEYARILVRSRHADRGLARRALSVELRRKGIDDDLAAEALTTVDAEQEETTARELVRRRLAATAGLAPEVRMRRVVAMLGRKGYSGGLAHRLVREMLAAEGSVGAVADTDGHVRGAGWPVEPPGSEPDVFADDD